MNTDGHRCFQTQARVEPLRPNKKSICVCLSSSVFIDVHRCPLCLFSLCALQGEGDIADFVALNFDLGRG